MNILRCIAIACAVPCWLYAQNPVSVEAFDEQGNNPSQLTLRLRITNNSTDTLNDVQTKYYLNYDRNKVLNLSPYYMAGATASIDTLGDFLAVNINVAKLAPGVFPNASGISLGMNYADWSALNKQGDFSYPNAGNFVVVNNIPVYANGTIIAGATPINDDVNEEPPKIRFVGIQPENTATRSAWVELQNYDTTSIDLSDFYLKWSASDSVDIGSGTLAAGQKMRICQSSSLECPNDDLILVISNFPDGIERTFSLSKNGDVLDSVTLGRCEVDAVACLRTISDRDKSGAGNFYSTGDFFKYIENIGWNVYSSSEIFAESDELPVAKPYAMSDTSVVALNDNGKVRLSWIPVNGAQSYVVSIYNKADKSLVDRQVARNNFVEVSLEMGSYQWNVQSFADVANLNDYVAKEGDEAVTILYVVDFDAVAVKLKEKRIVGVTPFAARKDTKLLDPIWGNLAVSKEWNREHLSHEKYDEEEMARCWAVAANTLDHYYGGTISQDEIKIYGMKYQYSELPPLFYFQHGDAGGATEATVTEVLHYLFGEYPTRGAGMPSLAVVKNALNRSVPDPIFVVVKGDKMNHDMIVDGYAVLDQSITFGDGKSFGPGTVFYHYLNPDNNGGTKWVATSSYNHDHYFIAENRTKVGRKNPGVDNDGDGDGVKDYDEYERFKSDRNHYDSDRDELNDYDEIYAFTKMCKVDDPKIGCQKFDYLDSDGDNLATYWDKDSDNGGEKDGDEVAAGRNMFDEADDMSPDDITEITWDLPNDITIYALNQLRVNDRSICYDGEGKCKVASESGLEDFAINIGVESVVGEIYSKGGVWLRSRAEVKGNVNTYFANANNSTVNIGAGVSWDGTEYPHDYREWPYKNVWDPAKSYALNIKTTQTLVVSAGQEKVLHDGDVYSYVKVESGATLRIESGEIYVGNIQFESGSTITFTNPGQQTILHADGTTIWRAVISNEDKELVARGFKLIQYSNKSINIEGDWAGTIHAARSRLVMGQAKKMIYGRFLASYVSMHQQSRIYRVDFDPITQSTNLVLR